MNRRNFIHTGLTAMGVFAQTARALAVQGSSNQRILVVLELSGGNDGLNTLVPYGDDAYYRQRPKIGIRAAKLRKIDDHFGFNSGMVGFEKLFKEGKLARIPPLVARLDRRADIDGSQGGEDERLNRDDDHDFEDVEGDPDR